MSSKIQALSVQDFKRVRIVEIQPSENGLTIIGGNNGQGKTSVLDAIAYALGGEAFCPSNPNNNGSETNAKIKVEIDGLTVERSGKNGALKVTDCKGMRGNQSLLNMIVSKFALDLGNFMKAKDSEKTKMLLDMFPDLRSKLDEMKKKSVDVYNERYCINQEIRKKQFQLDSALYYDNVPDEEVDIEAVMQNEHQLNEKYNSIAEKIAEANNLSKDAEIIYERKKLLCNDLQNKKDILETMSRKHEYEVNVIRNKIEEYKNQLDEIIKQYPLSVKKINDDIFEIESKIDSLVQERYELKQKSEEKISLLEEERKNVQASIDNIKMSISEIAEVNARVKKNKAYKELSEELSSLKNESDMKTKELEDIDSERKSMLQNADLPLDGLSIDVDGNLLYNGQKWDCMSGSERLKVATAISMNTKPGCGFVLVDGLEAMDSKTLEEFNEYLTKRGMQCIGTIVGENNATVIIEDGVVK